MGLRSNYIGLINSEELVAQKALLHVFAPLAFCFLLTYMVFQFSWGNHQLAILYLIASIVLGINILAFRFHKRIKVTMHVFLALGPIVLIPWQITGTFDGGVIVWLMAYIIFAMFFGGKRAGTLWLGLTYTLSVLVTALQHYHVVEQNIKLSLMWQMYFSSMLAYGLIMFFLVIRDRVDDKLLEQTLQLEQAQSLAKMGNWEWDIAKDRVVWSKGLYQIFGLTMRRKPVTYQTYLKVVLEADRKLVDEAIRRSLQTHEPFVIEHRVKFSDNSIHWILGQGKVELDGHNRAVKMLGTAQDITAKKEAELHQEAQTEHLQKLNDLMVGRELKMIELKKELEKVKKAQT